MPLRLPFPRRRPVPATGRLTPASDSHPKSGLYTEPVRVASVHTPQAEALSDGRWRASFLLTVKDADDRRCSDIFVKVSLRGPDRASLAEGTTDLMGQIRFRMTGPPGLYAMEVLDVAAGGLAWDREAAARTAQQTVGDQTAD